MREEWKRSLWDAFRCHNHWAKPRMAGEKRCELINWDIQCDISNHYHRMALVSNKQSHIIMPARRNQCLWNTEQLKISYVCSLQPYSLELHSQSCLFCRCYCCYMLFFLPFFSYFPLLFTLFHFCPFFCFPFFLLFITGNVPFQIPFVLSSSLFTLPVLGHLLHSFLSVFTVCFLFLSYNFLA